MKGGVAALSAGADDEGADGHEEGGLVAVVAVALGADVVSFPVVEDGFGGAVGVAEAAALAAEPFKGLEEEEVILPEGVVDVEKEGGDVAEDHCCCLGKWGRRFVGLSESSCKGDVPMGDLNSVHNRVVWVDIPVADLDRAAAFYAAVLAIKVHREKFGDFSFCVLDHKDGNGGCLIPKPDGINSTGGILVYMNVDGRIRDAVAKVESLGGKVVKGIESIGPHGFRALILDSEGNRLALHSTTDG